MPGLGAIFVVDDASLAPDSRPDAQSLRPEGVLTGQQWRSLDGGITLAAYDVQELNDRTSSRTAPSSGTYECEQLYPGDLVAPDEGDFLYFIRLRVDPGAEEEWNRWYNEEHVPQLAEVSGVLCARRFRARRPDLGGRNYIATYHLTSPEIPRAAEWKNASDSEWSRRMKPHHQPAKLLAMLARY